MSTLIEPSLSATAILACCHQLPSPALLYSGTSGAASDTGLQAAAILCFSPEQTVVASNIVQLQALLATLKAHSSQTPVTPSSERFQSGWLGYFSYDAGVALASLKPSDADHPQSSEKPVTPLAEFSYYPFSLKLDLATDSCTVQNPLGRPTGDMEVWLSQLLTLLSQPHSPNATSFKEQLPDWQPAWSKAQYTQAFERIHQYLLAGDTYQVNLTMPFLCAQDLTQGNPMTLLRRFNAPFSCYYKTDALTLFSVTPERFLRIERQQMTTSPIKGTIPRGQNPQQDRSNKEWLQASTKNQAENLMIVDLLRNDLGRSATAGSVTVTRLFDIESHANVHHMVSTIQAQKSPTLSNLDAIINAFPGGSITGAPKKRAMEIIEELERQPRSLYCGSFGYFDDTGLTDFNILIRSIIATPEQAVCWGGGGLVIDSTVDSEYEEIHNKVDRILETPMFINQESAE